MARVATRPRRRRAAVTALVGLLAATVPAELGRAGDCLRPPVDAPIVDHFRDPPCPWCAGNRGLQYATRAGTIVRAAGAGEVTFAGLVAGVRYVVIAHADGLRATYGGLAASALEAGDRVPAGAAVGTADTSLHFGLRRGDRYVDPEPRLGRLQAVPRLVPIDGTPSRPGPPPRLRCPMAAGGPIAPPR